jgi:hypothetical protein
VGLGYRRGCQLTSSRGDSHDDLAVVPVPPREPGYCAGSGGRVDDRCDAGCHGVYCGRAGGYAQRRDVQPGSRRRPYPAVRRQRHCVADGGSQPDLRGRAGEPACRADAGDCRDHRAAAARRGRAAGGGVHVAAECSCGRWRLPSSSSHRVAPWRSGILPPGSEAAWGFKRGSGWMPGPARGEPVLASPRPQVEAAPVGTGRLGSVREPVSASAMPRPRCAVSGPR